MIDKSQGDLFERPKAPVFAEPKKLGKAPVGSRTTISNLRDRAEKWIDDHPEEFGLLLKWARQILAKKRRFGIAFLWEKLRWEYMEADRDCPKLDNSLRAYISLALIAREPQLDGLLECRAVSY